MAGNACDLTSPKSPIVIFGSGAANGGVALS
jgi:hypothetical protein